MTEPEIIFNK